MLHGTCLAGIVITFVEQTFAMCPFTELEEVLLEETLLADGQKIVLFNDDVHSFDFVIEALIEVCGHELLQAEQCTIIVHYKGKCAVKNGAYEELEPMCTALLERGLTAEIQ
jgi:ATP-dependent Clp protease adaptor protein ClpS